MRWAVYNAADYRWGHEDYPTKEAAFKELKEFYESRQIKVDLNKFRITELYGNTGA